MGWVDIMSLLIRKTKGLFQLLLGCVSCVFTLTVLANPSLNNIGAGNVTITQTPNTTTIEQSSSRAILNWNNFNIAKGQRTSFYQPFGGVALNRINANQGASQIYGTLTATGQIILVNSAGIYFGPSSYVNVGGMIATTSDISNKNFLGGNYIFQSTVTNPGSIVNEGTIIAANHGLVALVGSDVTNNGLIKANLGQVLLASGNDYTMSFDGNNLINFTIGKASANSNVTNNGRLIADGGQIEVTAAAAQGTLDNIINMNGVAEAKSIGEQNGDIIISGDPKGGIVSVAANINASGKQKGQTGGTVNITGNDVLLTSPTVIDVSGDVGGGNVNIGGDEHGAGSLANANATVMMPGATILANAIDSGNGGNVVLWSEDATKAYGNIFAEGGALGGNGGNLETSSHNYLDVNGIDVNLSAAKGATGNWLLDPADLTICQSCTNTANFSGDIYSPGSGSSMLLSSVLENELGTGANITIETSASGTGGNGDINVDTGIEWSNGVMTLSAYRNINIASGVTLYGSGADAGLALIANNAGAFDLNSSNIGTVLNYGSIDTSGPVTIAYNPASYASPGAPAGTSFANSGAGAVTAYMLVNNPSEFEDINSYSSSNFALSQNINAAGIGQIGNFSGNFDGLDHSISNFSLSEPFGEYVALFGTVSGNVSNINVLNANINGAYYAGALIGNLTNTGSVTNAYATGTVTIGSNGNGGVGGLVGSNSGGTISDSGSAVNITTDSGDATSDVGGLAGQNAGTITSSYSTGNVNGGFSYSVGGLVGFNNATINNSYSTGNVYGDAATGGFVGYNQGTINQVYSTGKVTGYSGRESGGLFGYNTNNISNSFWNTSTSGQSSSGDNPTGTLTNVTGETNLAVDSSNTAGSIYAGAGWNIGTDLSNTWVALNNQDPLLASQYSDNIVTPTQLALIGLNSTTEAASYKFRRKYNSSFICPCSRI